MRTRAYTCKQRCMQTSVQTCIQTRVQWARTGSACHRLRSSLVLPGRRHIHTAACQIIGHANQTATRHRVVIPTKWNWGMTTVMTTLWRVAPSKNGTLRPNKHCLARGHLVPVQHHTVPTSQRHITIPVSAEQQSFHASLCLATQQLIGHFAVKTGRDLLYRSRNHDEAFGYLKRVIVTLAVYPRLFEFISSL